MADFVITSDWEDRYRAERSRYQKEYAVYQWLRQNFVEVQVFRAEALTLGPTITVFKRTPEVADLLQRDD